MSMKHPQKYMLAAQKKRRANDRRKKEEQRERRARLATERQAQSGAAK